MRAEVWRLRLWFGIRCVTCWMVIPHIAHARSAAHTYALDYDAPDTCSSSEQLSADLDARGVIIDPSARAALVIRVSLEQSQYLGTLVLREENGELTERRLEAFDCAELSSAMVLIAGLLTQGRAPDAQPALAEPPVPAPAKATRAPRRVEEEEAPHRGVRSVAGQSRLGVGAGLLSHGGVAPSLAYGPLLFGEVRARRSGVFLPAFRLGFGFAQQHSHQPEGSARLDWLAARAWFAPLRWPEGPVGLELSAVL